MNEQSVQTFLEFLDKNTDRIATSIGTAIEAIADAMGIAIPELYKILVRQQYVEATVQMIYAVVGILLSIVCYKWIKQLAAKGEKFINDWDVLGFIAYMVLGLGVAVSFITTVDSLSKAVRYSVNPHYYAIQDIVETVQDFIPSSERDN